MGYKQQTFMSNRSEDWEGQDHGPTDLGSVVCLIEDSLSGLQKAISSCNLPGVSFSKTLIPIMRATPYDPNTTQQPYLPLPSSWG